MNNFILFLLILTASNLLLFSKQAFSEPLILCEEKRGLDCTISNERVFHPRYHNPIIIKGHLTLKKGAKVTFSPGITVKTAYKNGSINVHSGAELIAQGSTNNPIVFTSINDSTEAEYTYFDHDYQTPKKWDWAGLFFHKGSKIRLSNVQVNYAGAKHNNSAVTVKSGNVVFKDSQINNSHGAPLALIGKACSATVENNTFKNNGVNATILSGCLIDQDTVLPRNSTYHARSHITVNRGSTLRLMDGVNVKFADKIKFHVNGRLVTDGLPNNKVVLTSIYDDSAGGDTNNDGDITTGKPKTWGGINFGRASSGSFLNHTTIKYAGYNTNKKNYSIATSTSQLSLNAITIVHSENTSVKNDLELSQKVRPNVSNSDFIGYKNNINYNENSNKSCQAPNHRHFLLLSDPSCSQEWDYHIFLTQITNYLEATRKIISIQREREIQAHDLIDISIDVGSALYSTFSPSTLSGKSRSGFIELQKALVVDSIDKRTSGAFSTLLKETSLIAYQIATDYSFEGTVNLYPILVNKALHLSNHTQSYFKQDNFIEDFNGLIITQDYLWKLLKHGGNYAKLADSLDLPMDVPLKELISVLAKKNEIQNKIISKDYRYKSVAKSIQNYSTNVIGQLTGICSQGNCLNREIKNLVNLKDNVKSASVPYIRTNAINQFISENTNRGYYLEPADNDKKTFNKGQCVAGALKLFNHISSQEITTQPGANKLRSLAEEKGFQIIDKYNQPQVGAMIVWLQKDGSLGHVGVISDVNGNEITFYDSNWPSGKSFPANRWGITAEQAASEKILAQDTYGKYIKNSKTLDNPYRDNNQNWIFDSYILPK